MREGHRVNVREGGVMKDAELSESIEEGPQAQEEGGL